MNISNIIISALVFSVSFLPFNLFAKDGLTDSERDNLLSLDWKCQGTYHLPESHSKLVIPDGYIAVFGKDSTVLDDILQGTSLSETEAIVISDDFQNSIYFSSHNVGYISLEDWESLNAKDLIKSISENTEKANMERRRNGVSELHIVGWIQEPSLDKCSNTVFWSIEGIDEDEGAVINSTAIRLGKKGFERVIWVTGKENYNHFGGELDIMLRSHSYDPGYRYSDFSKGDKIASYGVASLVAATVGGKIVKSGGILLGLKKLWGIIAVGFMAVLGKIKNFFKRGSND